MKCHRPPAPGSSTPFPPTALPVKAAAKPEPQPPAPTERGGPRHSPDRPARAVALRQAAHSWILRIPLILALAAPHPARAEVRQLTHDGEWDSLPQINNAGQVVWQRDREIVLWDGTALRQLTHSRNASNPQINDAGQVVWEAQEQWGSEIYLWDGANVRRLTDNRSPDVTPQINRAGQAVWEGARGLEFQIFLWDGVAIRQLSQNTGRNFHPRINSAGHVVWDSNQGVCLWNGALTRVLERTGSHPQINDRDQVVWIGSGGPNGQVYLWQHGRARPLTGDSTVKSEPQINIAGQVAWIAGEFYPTDVYLWNGAAIRKLHRDSAYSPVPPSTFHLQINDSGQVLWQGGETWQGELYLWNGSSVQRITHNQERHASTDAWSGRLNNAGSVVWAGSDGRDWDIYQYTAPAPGSISLEPTSVLDGSPALAIITLGAPAPAGGAAIGLASEDPSRASLPPGVLIPEGQTTALVPVITHPVSPAAAVRLAASYRGETWTTTLWLLHPRLAGLDLGVDQTVGGTSPVYGTVTLDGEAPAAGAVLTLTCENPVARVPPTITVPPRATSAVFPITTVPVAAAVGVRAIASYEGARRVVTLRVLPPRLSYFAVYGETIAGGTEVTGQVQLDGPAPTGALVAVSSSDRTVVSVPDVVTIPPGATTTTFSITTHRPARSSRVRLSASRLGATRTVDLTIAPAGLASLSVNPATVTGGNEVIGKMTLDAPAPEEGLYLWLGSDKPAVSMPFQLRVPAGATTATFPIRTPVVMASTPVIVTAFGGGIARRADLVLLPPAVAALSLDPASVTGGGAVTGTVSLTGPAPAGGVLVTLISDRGSAPVPGSVLVAAGMKTATFTLSTQVVAEVTTATITARGGGERRSAALTLRPPGLASLVIPRPIALALSTASGTITLTAPAPPGGAIVALTSSDPARSSVPARVQVPAGATSAWFGIRTGAVDAPSSVLITAGYSGTSATATLRVDPARLAYVGVDPSEAMGATTLKGGVSLAGVAPTGGLVIALTSDRPDLVQVPASATVPAGQNWTGFPVVAGPVTSLTEVRLTASLNGGTRTFTFVLYPVGLAIDLPNPTGGTRVTGRVTLGAPAPTGGAVVNLVSGDPGRVTAPASVTVRSGATTATFPIATRPVSAVGEAPITASYGGVTRIVRLRLLPPTIQSFTVSRTLLAAGDTATATVTLETQAPDGGLVVRLATDHPASVQIPGTVTVPAGAKSASFAVLTRPVRADTTLYLTASGWDGVRGVNVRVFPVGLSLGRTAVPGGDATLGVLVLDGPAPPGGTVVALSSSDPAAAAPARITVPAGERMVLFHVSTSPVAEPTSVTLTAAGSNASWTASLRVEPPLLTWIGIAPSQIKAGKEATVTLGLTSAAPAGGVLITLASQNGSAINMPATVQVPAGATSVRFPLRTAAVKTVTDVRVEASYRGSSLAYMVTVVS